MLTVLQYPFPGVRLALWRDADALAAGQWWRLVTPLLVQYDAWWQILVVFALLAGLALTAFQDMHGPPILVGFALGALLLWRDRRRSR